MSATVVDDVRIEGFDPDAHEERKSQLRERLVDVSCFDAETYIMLDQSLDHPDLQIQQNMLGRIKFLLDNMEKLQVRRQLSQLALARMFVEQHRDVLGEFNATHFAVALTSPSSQARSAAVARVKALEAHKGFLNCTRKQRRNK